MERYDVVIAGKGPAGISAALYTQRAGLRTLIVAPNYGALDSAGQIENYYGFPDGIDGPTLVRSGEAQAQKLGVSFVTGQVTGLMPMQPIEVETTAGQFACHALVLATGKAKLRPTHPDVAAYEGKGVSYCAVCDGFFHRGKQVFVLGSGAYAIKEAEELIHLASVTILTDGATLEETPPAGVLVDTRPIDCLYGEQVLEGVRFQDGETWEGTGFFVAIGTASAAALAKKTGLETDGDWIRIDAAGRTNLPGVFAAGDCTGGFLQVSKAVADGALAAKEAIAFVRSRLKTER